MEQSKIITVERLRVQNLTKFDTAITYPNSNRKKFTMSSGGSIANDVAVASLSLNYPL